MAGGLQITISWHEILIWYFFVVCTISENFVTPAAFFSCYVFTVVTPPTTTEFTAFANNRSNSSNPPAVKSVTLPGSAVLLLVTDSGFNIWWGTWDEPKVWLSECVTQGTPKPSAIVIPSCCPAIHRAEDRVLHSHSESFTEERNTMKSE